MANKLNCGGPAESKRLGFWPNLCDVPHTVFNTERMNEAVSAFRRYEDASLRYTGIESHERLTH